MGKKKIRPYLSKSNIICVENCALVKQLMTFAVGEQVLCYHGPKLYEAKVSGGELYNLFIKSFRLCNPNLKLI